MDAASLKAAGWTCHTGRNFTSVIGPIWVRGQGPDREIGMIVGPDHTNDHLGVLHGGALMTFADICLGYCASAALGGARSVTAQLQAHFVAAGKVGQFISCRPEIVRRGTHLIFVRGLIKSGDEAVANVVGIWKALEEK